MNKKNVLLYSNHFKRCWFFEDTVKRLANAGYQWVILLTGSAGYFRSCGVVHKNVNIITTSQTSYDGGMMLFKQNNILNNGAEYLVHIDNDCFLSDICEFEEYLHEFIDDNYDYACHLVGNQASSRYNTDTHITHVDDQQIIPNPNNPNDIPTPEPHYENAYQIIRKGIYDKLTVDQVGHHRRFLAALHSLGAKMGSHKANYRWDYTNWGQEWFHVGHIFEKYMQLESSNIEGIQKYNPDSEFDLFRAGFFAAQERCYGNIYPEEFKNNLNVFYNHMGGKDKVLACWDNLTKETCMKNWQRL